MRMTAKAEYAVRAMVQLAALGEGQVVKSEALSSAQEIPAHFLADILSDLRAAHLVRSRRGAVGGYSLDRPAAEITVADVLRAIDGPLASVHDVSLARLTYTGPAAPLTEVWMALRASMRDVLERITLADVVEGRLPEHVRQLAGTYREQESTRGH